VAIALFRVPYEKFLDIDIGINKKKEIAFTLLQNLWKCGRQLAIYTTIMTCENLK